MISLIVIPVNAVDEELSSVGAIQKAMFIMETINISQGMNGSYSHRGSKAIDLAGRDSGKDPAYAPFDGKVVYMSTNAAYIIFESLNPVEYAEGTVDYMTVWVMHDDNIGRFYVGQTFSQGEHFFNEGSSGNAIGNHIHLECAKGKYARQYQNIYGVWCLNNQINPYDALYLSESTNIINGYGYNWRRTNSDNMSSHILSGVYVIHSAWDDNMVMDIQGDSKENDANIQLYQKLNNDVQKFRIIRYGDYYCIKSIYSDKWLDVKLPIGDNANVKLYYENTNEENDWQFIDAGDGYFYIRNRTGYYLDVQGDRAVNNANLQLYHYIGNNSQKWRLEDVTKYVNAGGVCKIRSAYNNNMCLDIAGNSTEDRANIQLFENTNDDVQKFRIYKEGNYSCFKSVYSGKWLDIGLPIQNKANVQLWWNNDSDEDKWIFEDAGNGYVYIQSKTGFYLDLEKDDPVNRANIQVYHFIGNNSQRWRIDDLTSHVPVDEGIYTIHSAWDDNMCLDIQGNSTENRANVILYQYENTNMQKYHIIKNGNYYWLKSIHANKWLDIKTPFNNNSNVQLWESNSSDEENWIFEDAGNGYVYIRSKLGYYLDLQGDNPVNRANIQIYNYIASNSQKWKLKRVLQDEMVTVEDVTINNDSASIDPSVTVKVGNKTLKKGTDYSVTITVDNSKTKGKVTVTGKGNYSGSITKEFKIVKLIPIQESWINVNSWDIIDDESHVPSVTVKMPGRIDGVYVELVKGKDYMVTVPEKQITIGYHSLWSENPPISDEIGKNYQATITGIGAYTGSIDIYERKNLSNEMVVVHSWSKSDNCYLPYFDLFDGNKKLVKGVDYTFQEIMQTMSNWMGGNPPVKYAVRIIGKGDYYGKLLINCEKVEQTESKICGDVDNDGEVTIIDATCIQRKLANIATAKFNETAADTDEDGELTIIDATVIQRWLAQLPTNENIGKPIA
jgi:hypothetical protein